MACPRGSKTACHCWIALLVAFSRLLSLISWLSFCPHVVPSTYPCIIVIVMIISDLRMFYLPCYLCFLCP